MHSIRRIQSCTFHIFKCAPRQLSTNNYSVKNTRISSNIAQRHRQGYNSYSQSERQVSNSADASSDPWRLRRKYVTTMINQIDAKPQGVTFDVKYLDTGADWHFSVRRTTPTVLAVHDLPGAHPDLLPVMQPLHDLGCRVIVVNLPGYSYTTHTDPADENLFHHSTSELSEFLFSFLGSLEVKQLDMLVTHGAGAQFATVLTVVTDIVKSLVTVCPLPGHAPQQGASNQRALEFVMKLYQTPFLKRLVSVLLPTLYQWSSKLTCDNPAHLATLYRSTVNQNFDMLESMVMDLEMKQIPIVYVCSKNDDVIGYELSKEWASKNGLAERHFDEYDDDYNLIQQAEPVTTTGYKKGVVMSQGGHCPQFKTDTALPILMNEIKLVLDMVSKDCQHLKQGAIKLKS